MGNCDSQEEDTENINIEDSNQEKKVDKKKQTHYESYIEGLKEKFRLYRTKKGLYMLWKTEGQDILGYLIRGVYDDIKYNCGPVHFANDGGGAFKKGDIMYHTYVVFKRCVSNPNIIKPVATRGRSDYLPWYPFMPKSARIARNNRLAQEQKNQERIIHKIIPGEKIELRNDCKLWYVRNKKRCPEKN